jgi:class 3 adenylate cyclase
VPITTVAERGSMRYTFHGGGEPSTAEGSRLSTEASARQTLIGQRVFAATEDAVETAPASSLNLKGFARPVVAYEVVRSRVR